MSNRCSIACIIPPVLLEELLRRGSAEERDALLRTLSLDAGLRTARVHNSLTGARVNRATVRQSVTAGQPQRTIFDCHGLEPPSDPDQVRAEGDPASDDVTVNEAYDGLGDTYAFYWEQFQRDSIDAQGMPLAGLVHYGTEYDNAFWDNAGHMFFGDGDGRLLTETTAGIDVIGHELTHGVTQHEANLVYSGQSGALNESISDVFGIQVKQMALGQDVATSDWLIGADIVGPELQPALRSMKDPGHANPHDDQPADMDGYVDGGDVHTNSGIPNRAFCVVATELGGNSWDAAGPIWYATLCDPQLRSDASFSDFARLTLVQAQRRYGSAAKEVDAVRKGWDTVKVSV